MSASVVRRVARPALCATGAGLSAAVAAVAAVASATPAAAHNVGGGALPAPPWLLSYIGAFAVAATAVALRATWRSARLTGFVPAEAGQPHPNGGGAARAWPHPGNLLGLALLVLTLVAAIVGPDSSAANIAPVAVFVIWWVGLPIACLVAGDVMRAVNPFMAVVVLVDRRRIERDPADAPTWTSAAFLAAFAWFFVAYHRPGSPRALAVFLIAYTLAAVLGGLRWGRAWLATGEAFGALSAAVALLSPWRRRTTPPPGLVALMVVWLGSTAFDAFASTPFWADVVGTSQGWTRTLLNTVGLVWLTAIVAGTYLLALRVAGTAARTRTSGAPEAEEATADEADQADEDPSPLIGALGVALVPIALSWFLAHDLTLLLFEGQNFIALASDPIGRGWDLFGTIGRAIDFGIVQSTWVRWSQVALLGVGHVVAVVIAHDVALRVVRRRAAMQATWAMAAAGVASIVAGALLVLG